MDDQKRIIEQALIANPDDLDALQSLVEYLRNLVDLQRRLAETRCAKIAELDAENQRLQAELAAALGREKQLSQLLSEYESRDMVQIATEMEIALGDMQERVKILEAALPDPEFLEQAVSRLEGGQFFKTVHELEEAAARIRAVQEVQNASTR